MNEQMDLFAASYEPFKIEKTIRLIECFGGIGAQSKALEILGADFEHHRLVEWAWKSILAYNAIHVKDFADHSQGLSKEGLIERVRGISTDYNKPLTDKQLSALGEEKLRQIYSAMVACHDYCPDISRLKGEDLQIEEKDKYCYVLTYSFPCQDLSIAGLTKGMDRDSGTRSGLLWQVERILLECKALGREKMPDVLIMENVPQVCGSKNIKPWGEWLNALQAMGYTSYFKIVNAKDCGIPQNRQRCFMVSILGERSFEFLPKMPLKYHLKDFLDPHVDEKYYLSDELVAQFQAETEKEKAAGNGFAFEPMTEERQESGSCHSMLARYGERKCDTLLDDSDEAGDGS